MAKRYSARSIERYRATAAEQRRRGLKVGGTVTKFFVCDHETGESGYVFAYGATPGERKTAAIEAFVRGEGDDRRVV